MPQPLKYVVITPARNEAQYIELVIRSMIAQTQPPLRWVIVSDGSTDGTDEIVGNYSSTHPWIELLRMPERTQRHFAGKVHAFRAGYDRVKGLEYDVIASLDGDISFDAHYFSFLLGKLDADATLGLVGTPFQELSGQAYDYRFVAIEHVSGACQVFRRACFEAIGGYMAVKGGSIDHIAVITARMHGWRTRTFIEKTCLHHRAIGTAQRGVLKARFRYGIKDFAIGNHPLWELFRVARQMMIRPAISGGLLLGCGYTWAWLKRTPHPISNELISFHRREQLERLKGLLRQRRTQADVRPRRLPDTRLPSKKGD